jgi:hypothetical protein
MIVKVLLEAGIAAGYIIGGELPGYGNAAAGTDPIFVLEADEYDHMFLGLRPTVADQRRVGSPRLFPDAGQLSTSLCPVYRRGGV